MSAIIQREGQPAQAQPRRVSPLQGSAPAGRYCRTGCPVLRGQGAALLALETRAQARALGLCACRRCQPDRVTHRQWALARARTLLETSLNAPDLVTLAQAVGLGRAHFQRVFRAAFGLSPKQYALQLRAGRVREALRRSASVTEALYEAGHNTPRSLYDRKTERLGMTPGQYRSGGEHLSLRFAVIAGASNFTLIAATDRGVCALYSGEDEHALLRNLEREFPRALLVRDAAALAPLIQAVQSSVTAASSVDQPLRRRVWAALGQQPHAPSYLELARTLGLDEDQVAAACEQPPQILPWPQVKEQPQRVTSPAMTLCAVLQAA